MADQQRVAVRRGLGESARPDATGGARAVLDHELLAERAPHVLAEQPRQDVVAAAGREWHDDGDRPDWIGLRDRRGRRAYDKKHKDPREASQARHKILPYPPVLVRRSSTMVVDRPWDVCHSCRAPQEINIL